MVEREAGQATEERQLLTEGIRRFPSFWKLHLMLGQLEERQGGWCGLGRRILGVVGRGLHGRCGMRLRRQGSRAAAWQAAGLAAPSAGCPPPTVN